MTLPYTNRFGDILESEDIVGSIYLIYLQHSYSTEYSWFLYNVSLYNRDPMFTPQVKHAIYIKDSNFYQVVKDHVRCDPFLVDRKEYLLHYMAAERI